jgi:uncharacterized protein
VPPRRCSTGPRRRRCRRDEDEGEEVEFDATLTFSAEEKLKKMDFEQMSTAELAQARRAIARLDLPVKPIASRRTASIRAGRRRLAGHDARALRSGGDIRRLAMRSRRTRWPNLVALCDISGSMSSYSRMVLHFLHAAANAKGQGWAQVHAFTFGTRLTNITRHLRQRDVDAALAAAGRRRRTGRAAPGSGPACTPSTATGRGACWGRGRWCC